jgi:hypothetical protein
VGARHGGDWDVMTPANEACEGNLDLIQWVYTNGCLWDDVTTANAAEYGQLTVLRWCCSMVVNGMLWSVRGSRRNMDMWKSFAGFARRWVFPIRPPKPRNKKRR